MLLNEVSACLYYVILHISAIELVAVPLKFKLSCPSGSVVATDR